RLPGFDLTCHWVESRRARGWLWTEGRLFLASRNRIEPDPAPRHTDRHRGRRIDCLACADDIDRGRRDGGRSLTNRTRQQIQRKRQHVPFVAGRSVARLDIEPHRAWYLRGHAPSAPPSTLPAGAMSPNKKGTPGRPLPAMVVYGPSSIGWPPFPQDPSSRSW